ncbi:MAG: hypothetical protein KIT84_23390 [Labilithrix sp.]|nr:hypothetical protein [Labilithrix sp.]MCW5813992.1 hypothetical protein [Labilithrix sp.]
MRLARRVVLAAALALLGATACGGGEAKPPPRQESGPSWTDIFDRTPDIYVVIRPQSLKKDSLYGSFWRALVAAAQARGIARGATMVEAVEGAQDIIVGVNQSEAALVLRSVPARLDPAKVAGEDGRPLFRSVSDERKKVIEYEVDDRRVAGAGSLFVLPDRTWVGVLGGGRDRARASFASPANRPAPETSATALVSVRLGGAFLRLFERHALLGPLTKKLTSATIELQPGSGGVVVALAYAEAAATAYGEMQAKKIAAELAKAPDRAWLKDAKIAYEGDVVFVRVSVPPRLLEELPKVRGEDLGL